MCKKLNIAGSVYRELTVLSLDTEMSKKMKKTWWWCKCSCGRIKSMLGAHLTAGLAISCRHPSHRAQANSLAWKGCGKLSGTFFNAIKRRSRTRGLDFNLKVEDLWALFLSQKSKCKISGIPLQFSTNNKTLDGNASLDRIDSSKGYMINNVQWVDKTVNFAKQKLSDDEFIKLCKTVYLYNQKLES